MRTTLKLLTFLLIVFVFSCGGGAEEKKETTKVKIKQPTETVKKTETAATTKPSESIDLTNKGVGPITSLNLGSEIDQAMVVHGAEVFKKMCTACHKEGRKFIGPAPNGITERRTPEWIMNMILDPEGMTQNDPLAKALLIEFNGSPMANQNLSEDDARAVLEYFRTLK